MSIIRHKIESMQKNTNIAERQNQELAEISFDGIYPPYDNKPARANISIDLIHWYEKTSRRMLGSIDLTREQLIALRNDLNTMIESDKWSESK